MLTSSFPVFIFVMFITPGLAAFAIELLYRRQRVITALAIAAGPVLIFMLSMVWGNGASALDWGLVQLAGYAYALALSGALIGTGAGMLFGWIRRRLSQRGGANEEGRPG